MTLESNMSHRRLSASGAFHTWWLLMDAETVKRTIRAMVEIHGEVYEAGDNAAKQTVDR
jgi:hypothetical protein